MKEEQTGTKQAQNCKYMDCKLAVLSTQTVLCVMYAMNRP